MKTKPFLSEKHTALKGQCHETFWHFFHESNLSGPLLNRLKWFFLKIRFRGDICEISDSAQANTARSQTLRKLTLYGVKKKKGKSMKN